MNSIEMHCPHCRQEVVINCDDKGPLDADCPECGDHIYDLAREEWLDSLIGWGC